MTGVVGVSDFPAAIDSHTTLMQVKDLATTTLTTTVNSSVTTFVVASTAAFPSTGFFVIEGEIVTYGSKDSTHFLSCTRGAFTSLGGGAAAGHTSSAVIKQLVIAATHEVQNDALIATQTKLGSGADTPASGELLKGTGAGTSGWAALTSGEINTALGFTAAEGPVVQQSDSIVAATASTIDFDGDYFAVTESPAKEANVTFASGAVQDAGTLSIASGVLTLPTIKPNAGIIRATIDTESAAASDDLDTITPTGSIATGTILILTTLSSSRDVTAKNGTGNLTLTDGDFVMGTTSYRLTLQRSGSSWVELARRPIGIGSVVQAWDADLDALAASPANYLNPSGAIVMYGGSAAPTGWLLCDGTSYLRADYSALFTAIGTAFGSADGTHFNVPDLRDRFPIGKGVDTANDALGETGGARNVTLTSAQSGLPAHGHGVGTLATGDPGDHTHTYVGNTGTGSGYAPSGSGVLQTTRTSGAAGAHTHTLSGSVANNTAADAASSHTNMPPFLTINFIIKA